MITYDSIEPFGGYKLQEKDENVSWHNGMKDKFFATSRPKGIYLYHKSGSTLPHMLFQVINDAEIYRIESPVHDGYTLSVYADLTSINNTDLQYLFIINGIFHSKQDFLGFRDLYLSQHNKPGEPTAVKFDKKNEAGIGYEFLLAEIKKEKVDIDKAYKIVAGGSDKKNVISATVRNKLHFKGMNWDAFQLKYKPVKNDIISMRVTEDVGIYNPQFTKDATYIAYLDSPKIDELIDIGFKSNSIKITKTSIEKMESGDYEDKRYLGKSTHDIRDDVSDAITAAKGVQIGWAGHPSDM